MLPDVFATGGRDGQIRLWDTRTSCYQKQGQTLKKPVNVYRNTHVIRGIYWGGGGLDSCMENSLLTSLSVYILVKLVIGGAL